MLSKLLVQLKQTRVTKIVQGLKANRPVSGSRPRPWASFVIFWKKIDILTPIASHFARKFMGSFERNKLLRFGSS